MAETVTTEASAPVEPKTTEPDSTTATKKDESSTPASAPKPRKPWKKSTGPVTKSTDKPGSLSSDKRKSVTDSASDAKASESSKGESEG